jgi:hypothetical protein
VQYDRDWGGGHCGFNGCRSLDGIVIRIERATLIGIATKLQNWYGITATTMSLTYVIHGNDSIGVERFDLL